MKYEKPRNPAWPDWYDGKKINEVQFCYDFLKSHPLKCIDGQFYTPDGPVEDESEGYFRFKADAEVSSKCLYEVYKVWCDDNACRPVSPNRLSTELNQQSLRYNLEATNNIYLPGGRRVRGFVGIETLIHPCQQ